MKKNKSSISNAETLNEIGEFWGKHDLADFSEQTKPVDFDVDIQSEAIYYPLDIKLSDYVCFVASKRGISAQTLLNLWIQEKFDENIQKSA